MLCIKHHPTWRFEGGEAGYKLGGVLDEADGDAQNPLFHLITLDPLPRDLPVRSLPRLILAAHVREINEGEVVFYEHDAQGMPRRIGERTQVEYVQDEPIMECEVMLAPMPSCWGGSGLGDVKQQAKPRAHRRRALVDTGRLGAALSDMRREDGVFDAA